MTVEWPVALRGITETVVATRQPGDDWNLAALGVHAGSPATAVTWGRTRTRRNFRRTGVGIVQFTPDPDEFVRAALEKWTTSDPILESADAVVPVRVRPDGHGEADGTTYREWTLTPLATTVRHRDVRTLNRGTAAVVEATVAASRLDVPAYEDEPLLDRIRYFAGVADRCGGDPERAAMARLAAAVPVAIDGSPEQF